jgi:hypothetical protein
MPQRFFSGRAIVSGEAKMHRTEMRTRALCNMHQATDESAGQIKSPAQPGLSQTPMSSARSNADAKLALVRE